MNELKKYIDLQIKFNQGKNLFYKDYIGIMKFTQSTFDAIQRLNMITKKDMGLLIDYTTEMVLQELYRINQYYTFSEKDINKLKNIYWNLCQSIVGNEIPIDIIPKNHYKNLALPTIWWKEKGLIYQGEKG